MGEYEDEDDEDKFGPPDDEQERKKHAIAPGNFSARKAKIALFKQQRHEQGDIKIDSSKAHYLCRQLAKIRTIKGLTRGEVADMMGCDTSYITNMENGTKPPTLKGLMTYGLALDCRLEFVGWEPWHPEV